ncbi:hypothetical protein JCM11491_005110 [Sporobolomyces phaffii]
MYAKTYRAPTHEERAREATTRFVRDAERIKLDAIKKEEKRIREVGRLEREAAKLNDRSLGVSSSPYLRARSRSFGAVDSSGYLGEALGYPSMLGSVGARSPRMGFGSPAIARDQLRRRDAELAQQRARQDALTAEALNRQRTASMLARDREALARMHSPYLAAGPYPYGHRAHASPLLRRSRSFGSIPLRSPQQHLGAYPQPLGYPAHPYQRFSPRLGLHPPGPPPSPRVVNNSYSIYNTSPPRIDPLDVPYGSHCLQGGYDDFNPGGTQPFFPREDPFAYETHEGSGRLHDPGINNFVITDLSFAEDGRQVWSELGYVEGTSGALLPAAAVSEDERLNLAISNLTANAQQRGANAVLSVETGEDAAGMGEIIIRGRAIILG